MAVPARAYLSIGEVLNRLRGDFADITISKIRFLESEGLFLLDSLVDFWALGGLPWFSSSLAEDFALAFSDFDLAPASLLACLLSALSLFLVSS